MIITSTKMPTSSDVGYQYLSGHVTSTRTAVLPGPLVPWAAAHLEYRCLWVAVDGHDDLAVLHASDMLDGSTDANSNIQLRGHDLAGLANL
jgi:hypothetical protein